MAASERRHRMGLWGQGTNGDHLETPEALSPGLENPGEAFERRRLTFLRPVMYNRQTEHINP